MQILVPGLVLKNRILRMSFLNWLLRYWNWPSNLVIFKDTNDSISSSKEHTDSPWHNVAIEVHKISSWDTPYQVLIRGKDLGDYVHSNILVKIWNIMRIAGCSQWH